MAKTEIRTFGITGICVDDSDSDSDWLITSSSFAFFVCTVNVPLGFAGEYCCIYTVAMCCCEGYGFHTVYSETGCIYQRVWV